MDAEMSDDDDMNSCSNSSNSPEPDSEDDEVDVTAITDLQKKIESNPYVYDPHIQLISLLRKVGDLDRLRKAREDMSNLFPLTPELWLDWLTDEEKLASTDDEKKSVIRLFDKAIKDYTSVSLWLEYVQYVIGQMGSEDGLASVRQTFDKALTAVGIHILQGSLIWDAYREFENAILSSMEISEGDAEHGKKVEAQRNRVYNLFRRQLSVPLLYMDKTYKEFQELTEIDSFTEQQYEKALQMLEKVEPLEEALFKSESPHLDEYKRYIEFEKKEGNPARIQCIYERALLENCLVPNLWLEYTKYLDQVVKNGEIVLPVHERAIRNCPWSALCWNSYLLALERYKQPHTLIKSMFEKALNIGFTEGDEYRMLWLTYLDYLRRRIKPDISPPHADLDELNATFERATEHMTYYKDGDLQCSILQYWAKIRAKYFKDVSHARKLWSTIMNQGHHGESEMWMLYANFERLYGDDKHYRKVLLKGLHSASDWPETIGATLINFEREEGSIESLDMATEKYEKQMERVREKRLKAAERETGRQEHETQHKKVIRTSKKDTRKDRGSRYERPEKDTQMDSEGFKIPFVPSRGHQTLESKEDPSKILASNERLKRPAESEPSESKRRRVEEDVEHGINVKHDSSKDRNSVFLSNLSYDVEEEKIKETFLSVGDVQEVRLVKDYKGRSKGYCYILFSSQEEAVKALQKDRELLNERPMFVSPCENRKRGSSFSQPKFKFRTGLEKKKLFVKGLSFSTTKEDLETIFKEFGTLKAVRIVTYRNGHSKGLAFVEYESEASASAAVVKTDGLKIGEHTISVAISNPPERKAKQDFKNDSVTLSPLLGGGGSTDSRPRGRGRTQLSLLPRALQRSNPSQSSPTSIPESRVQNGGTEPSNTKKLSNEDFRSMLLKK